MSTNTPELTTRTIIDLEDKELQAFLTSLTRTKMSPEYFEKELNFVIMSASMMVSN